MNELSALLALAMSAFTSATILPGTSEALLVALALGEAASLPALFVVATTANVAGSCVNWLLGRQIDRFRNRSWFPVTPERLEQAREWYARYGVWSLLLSWMPVVGDPITVAAGALRTPFFIFLLLVIVAKAARYALVLWAVT